MRRAQKTENTTGVFVSQAESLAGLARARQEKQKPPAR